MTLFHPAVFLHDLLSFRYVTAAFTTLWISLASLALGIGVGLVLAVAQETGLRALSLPARGYIGLFRGTPVLLQIVFVFNVLPSFGIVLPGDACAVLALGLNEGAYIAEIIRAGFRAVGTEQRMAARALGLREMQIMRLVVLPQAVRIILPPMGNQFISMLKLTALISVIGVRELLLTADQAASSDFRYFEALSAAGIYYLALTALFMVGQHWLDRRFGRTGALTAGMDAMARND